MLSQIARAGLMLILLTSTLAQDRLPYIQGEPVGVRGRVIDPTGAFLPGVEVAARSTQIRLARVVVTDDLGMYFLPRLSEGPYTLSATLPGFLTSTKNVDIKSGIPGTIDFTLTVPAMGPGIGIVAEGEVSTKPVTKAAVEAQQRQDEAKRLVERMWAFTIQPKQLPTGLGLQRTTDDIYGLGNDALPALMLALEDPDVQMRRNAIVILLDFALRTSPQSLSRLDLTAALPALVQASKSDNDRDVRAWAEQTIDEIRKRSTVR